MLRFRLMVKRGHRCNGPQASEGEAQHGAFAGPGADSEEKHEPVSDIDTVVVDSLKVLDPKRPIREADIAATTELVR